MTPFLLMGCKGKNKDNNKETPQNVTPISTAVITVINGSGGGAMGNDNETFTLCYIVDITRSFRIDNINSIHTL